MASALSLTGVAAATARPSSGGGRGRRLRVASMATQKGPKPTPKTVSGTRRSVSARLSSPLLSPSNYSKNEASDDGNCA